MSKIAMTRAQRRKVDATVSDARRTVRNAAGTVRDVADDKLHAVADRARELGREGKRRGKAAGDALAGRSAPRKPWYLLAAVVGAIGAGIGAVATVIGRRVSEARRRGHLEDLSASVAKEIGVADVPGTAPATAPAMATATKPATTTTAAKPAAPTTSMPVNGSVPVPRGSSADRPM